MSEKKKKKKEYYSIDVDIIKEFDAHIEKNLLSKSKVIVQLIKEYLEKYGLQ